MEKKKCSRCGKEKEISEFILWKDKYKGPCKECKKEYLKNYYLRNKEKANKTSKEYYKENKERINCQNKEYWHKNKEQLKLKRKEYIKNHLEELKVKDKEYYKKNKNIISEKNKQYYLENKEEIIERNSKYFLKNRVEIMKKRNIRNKERRKTDNIYRLKCQVREMIKDSFKRKNEIKNKHAEQILGCKIDFFINYLLQTYKNNYGYEWNGVELVHIDHIIPLATAHTEEEIIKLCHYSNLQLLKAKDNLKKGTKLNYLKSKGE